MKKEIVTQEQEAVVEVSKRYVDPDVRAAQKGEQVSFEVNIAGSDED